MRRSEVLTNAFKQVGGSVSDYRKPASKKKRAAPLSVRLSDAELAALRKAAAGRSMNGFIRECLFGNAEGVSLSQPASEDHEALARVLGMLGKTDVFTNLAAISLAIEKQQLVADEDVATAIVDTRDAILEMRSELLRALGLRKN
jgi:hypothetical protein